MAMVVTPRIVLFGWSLRHIEVTCMTTSSAASNTVAAARIATAAEEEIGTVSLSLRA
jgi:hypothetical protein